MIRSFRLALLVVLLLPLLGLDPSASGAQATDPSSASADPLYAPIIDSIEEQTLADTADLTRYEIDAELTAVTDSANAAITGTVEITLRNHTGEPLAEVPFRLYGNADEYAEGGQEMIDVTVDRQPIEIGETGDPTLVTIELPAEVAVSDAVRIEYDFITTIPTDPSQSYGMFKFDTGANTYAMAHWFPMLAGWDAVYGWNTLPYSSNGDPVFTEAAVFDVALSAPSDLVVITSGSEINRRERGDITRYRYATGPSRDFVMAASEDFIVAEETVGETLVRSWGWQGSEDALEAVLAQSVRSLALFNELIGPYPYEEFDVVQMDIGNGAGGVEFPGIVYIGADFYDGTGLSSDPSFLEFIVVHEVAHQWFYNVIGNNQYMHAFIDESISNYLTVAYFAAEYGTEAAHHQANLQLRLGYFDLLFQEGDQIVDQPTDAFPTSRDYGIIVYGKGALAFQQLRDELGAEAFFAGLALYYDEFAFRVAQPSDMKAAFEEASGADLTEFWTHWFEEPAGEEDFDSADLARLLRELDEAG